MRIAEAWYRDVSPSALARFREELRAAVEFIGDYPLGAPLISEGLRGKVMLDFPFTLVYRVLPNRVRVGAVADQRRDPDRYRFD